MATLVRLAVLLAALLLTATAGAATSIYTVAGGGTTPSTTANGIPGTDVAFNFPTGVDAIGGNRDFIVVDNACRVYRVTVTSGFGDVGTLTPVAGNGSCSGGAPVASGSPLLVPIGLAYSIATTTDAGAGGFLVGDTFQGLVHKVVGGAITTVAGTGTCSLTPPTNGSAATSANLCIVRSIGHHPSTAGRFLIGEDNDNRASGGRVYEVSGTNITAVAGGGCPTLTGTTPATLCVRDPRGLTYDSNSFYFADRDRHVVWRVVGTTLQRIAGTLDTAGFSGDGGLATTATLNRPDGVAVLPGGVIVVADSSNCRIRKIAGGTITTIAGNTCADSTGDGGPSTAANVRGPMGIASYPGGLFIAEATGRRVRLIDRTSITAGPSGNVATRTANFTYESLVTSPSFRCRVFPPEVTALACGTASPGSQTRTVAADGTYTFSVFDNAAPADPTAAQRTWTADTQEPAPFGLREPADGATGLAAQPSFTWDQATDATSGVVDYRLVIGGADSGATPTCADGACSATPPAPLSEASHTWEVRAVDGAGNVRPSASRTFAVGNPPTASLVAAPNPALAGRPVTFDGSASSDGGGPITKFEWDLDGNGVFELDTGSTPRATRTYEAPATIPVRLRVTDGVGLTATATTSLRVTAQGTAAAQLGVTVNNGAQYTNDPDVTLTANFPAPTTNLLVSNDGGFLAARTLPVQRETEWRLDSSGPERLPKLVYVRFLLGPIVSETYIDDIILDERPPVVNQAAVVPAAATPARASVARLRTWRLRLRATDSNSGVSKVQVTAVKRRPGRLIKYKRKLSVRAGARPRFVRARDRAGNFSKWRKLR